MTELPRPAYISARRAWARRPPRGVYNHKTMRSWRSWRGLVALLLGTTLSEALLAPCAPKSPSYGRRSGFNLHMTGSPGHRLTKTDLKPAADLLPVPAFGKGSARKRSDTRGSALQGGLEIMDSLVDGPQQALDLGLEKVSSTRRTHRADRDPLLGRDEALQKLGMLAVLATLPTLGIAEEVEAAGVGTPVATPSPAQTQEILRKATRKALGGGASGAAASLLQIMSLMWLRTSMNYQYRYGGTLPEVLKTLWAEGGIPRFYRGLSFALVQTPLARFGDTASNALVLVLLDTMDVTRDLPLPLKTVLGSVAAGVWRLFIFPLDTLKTSLQVQGKDGVDQLKERMQSEGMGALYQGAVAQALATFVGHYPYFLVFNYLSSNLPLPPPDQQLLKLMRNAFMGLCAATVSDCCSNSIRVVKTTKQTSEAPITYQEALRDILEKDGVQGLLGRGLKTRLITNGLQGALFAVAWKYFESIINAT